MYSDLSLALGFDKGLPLKEFIFVSKDSLSDSGFVLQDILASFLKQDAKVILMNFSQSFSHYHYILSKIGLNLKQLRENGQVVCLDGLKYMSEMLEEDPNKLLNCNHPLAAIVTKTVDKNGLKSLYDLIRYTLKKFKDDSSGDCSTALTPSKFLLLIDEITILLNLGVPVSCIVDFVHYCYNVCFSEPTLHGCLTVGSHEAMDVDDDENHQLNTYFAHKCRIRVQVQGLPTGYSKDVHGKVLLVKKNSGPESCDAKNFHFKVEEKGAKLYPHGTSPAVL